MRCIVRALFAPAMLVLGLGAGLLTPTPADARYSDTILWNKSDDWSPRFLDRADEDKPQATQRRAKPHAKRHRQPRHAKHRRHRRHAARHREARRHVARHRRTEPTWHKRSLSTYGPKGSGQLGIASFYWRPQRVAAGGWFNPNAMTAAHRTLPFGTRVRVTHLASGRSVEVKINDRGPYIPGRIIDLSKAAAGVLRMHEQGIARVRVTVLGR